MKPRTELISDSLELIVTSDNDANIKKILEFLARDIERIVRAEIKDKLFDLANDVADMRHADF